LKNSAFDAVIEKLRKIKPPPPPSRRFEARLLPPEFAEVKIDRPLPTNASALP